MSESTARLLHCYQIVRDALLAERNEQGHWTGELSTSALSTATAVMALEMVRRDQASNAVSLRNRATEFQPLIQGGLHWLADHQNDDGGWGDTVKSVSNISTTMLAHAVFHATQSADQFANVVTQAAAHIERMGGVPAVVARYGKDKTFSVPILTHCALAGRVDWNEIPALPFELACLPPRFYSAVRLPVVSYALPALIAIGQIRHFHRKPRNPFSRMIRWFSIEKSLKRLESIQPSNGGFLEATPLTSFVTMSLAGMGLSDHPVARKGAEFIVRSVRPDGSWPIDTNLSTWVTTQSVNALGGDAPESDRPLVLNWLLEQQYRTHHPYTNAAPGGWAWTDLPGGVPDADDTPGAILAILNLINNLPEERDGAQAALEACHAGIDWLLSLQNRDGGWPTFCKGWGTLPFDRSAPDITAHALRAIWQTAVHEQFDFVNLMESAKRGWAYLAKTQQEDGSWLPLWFGNQFAPDDENATYGTARVLAAYRDAGLFETEWARRGLKWLEMNQNEDGGWGGLRGVPSSVEETSLAVEILLSSPRYQSTAVRGLNWLLDRVEEGTFREPSPIGFYFAKLWYFEKLYPLAFLTAALRRATSLHTDLTESASENHAHNR